MRFHYSGVRTESRVHEAELGAVPTLGTFLGPNDSVHVSPELEELGRCMHPHLDLYFELPIRRGEAAGLPKPLTCSVSSRELSVIYLGTSLCGTRCSSGLTLDQVWEDRCLDAICDHTTYRDADV